jgi:hypothetical protein
MYGYEKHLSTEGDGSIYQAFFSPSEYRLASDHIGLVDRLGVASVYCVYLFSPKYIDFSIILMFTFKDF